MTQDEQIIRDAAHDHFMEHGDKVKPKAGYDPHSSYDVLRGYLTKYAYPRVGRDWQNAEDVVQDAYVKTLETAKVNEYFNFGGLYKIWLDRAIRDLRIENKKMGEVILCDEAVAEEGGLTMVELAEDENAGSELLCEIQEKVDAIMEISNKIPPKNKAIIRLAVIFGYTVGEISDMVNLPPRKITNVLQYFKNSFRHSE